MRLDSALGSSLPVGVYRVSASVVRPTETLPRETNRLTMVLAPQMTNLPLAVARVGGTASFTIDFVPMLRAGQRAVLVLGQHEYLPQGSGSPAASLGFVIPNAPVSPPEGWLARLRIDDIESPIIDLSQPPPATPTFLNQRVVIT